MPVYEYECENGHKFERYAAITAKNEPLAKVGCPTCSGKNGKIVKANLITSLPGKPRLVTGVGGFYKPNA